nr:disease resistance protein RGA2-like [Quercus suber]XP_023875850.1 disease resistance protein RGA2-like [Quercus suber]
MAEGALFDLAGNVLQLLGSIIVEEVKLASSVETEIENLTNTVSTIRAVLLYAEMQSSHNHQIKDWLSKLKDVLHDADDLLDDFSTEVMPCKVMPKKVHLFSSSSKPLAFSPKMGHEIKAIREKLNAIAKDKEAFHFSQSLVEPQVMNRSRETYSFVLKDEVIGRENDKKEIMERLFDDNVVENISIIPIVGIGGMGKTTLAQLVYNDDNVQNNFEIKLWVCISDIFDVKRIVKEILEQLEERTHEESLEVLQNKLREKLNGKKDLIVLDDLWNEDNSEWLRLKNLLMVGARGSRILVTTRSESVARIIGATSWHTLRGLLEENAWSLFVKVASEQGRLLENEAFVSLGREIMGKCGGVPLAIRTIASLLCTKATENEWRSFKVCELSKITQEEENVILSTLKLSYNHLPSYLKQCFAYCRLFPKDYKIDVTTLINLWAAQGFIKLSDSKQRVEDVGRDYFMGLKKLVNLRHLDVSGCIKLRHMPLGLGQFTSLEILPVFFARQEGSQASSSSWYKKKQARSGGGLSELKELSNLGGSLLIFGLGRGEDDMVECKATNMKDKQHLQELSLWWDDKRDDGETECYDEMSLEGLQPHPNLKLLKLYSYMGYCPKLKGWWRNSDDDDDDNEPHHLLLPSFPPSLSDLLISDCPNLTSMPPFPYLKETLYLSGCSWKVLEQTMKMKMKMGAATTSTYFPLSQLLELELAEINDLESLPEEWLRNLVSLRKLSIKRCDGLVSLPWIGILTSLQTLKIGGCHNLTSLPQEIRNLTSLKELEIWGCPLLGQRCKRQIGEDWPFIAHVPRVYVDNQMIQNQREETISPS